jgi:hypothetical protein
MCIVLITPTGNRPAQIELCRCFMQRQTYTGEVVWIIVDDCNPRTTDMIGEGFKDKWTIVKIYPTPAWTTGQNTQARNIAAGIDFAANYNPEAIFIIEDDDYYKPQYLQRMMDRMTVKVLGELNTVYYNIFYRNYFINRNQNHVSLFQIAFTPDMIPLFKTCYNDRFIDFNFYQKLHAQGYVGRGEVGFFNESNLAIGIKGMKGRAGIGAGHGRLMNMLPDPGMNYLISQIGPEDAKLYERYYGNHSQPQHRLFNTHRV